MTRPLNILHLSDLHYSQKQGHNIAIVLDALVSDLTKLSESNLKPDVVVFSGDLVQAADDADVYLYFNDAVLDKIAKATGCSLSRFVFTPGNHDVQQMAVAKHLDRATGFLSNCTSREYLNEAYLAGKLDDFAADKLDAYRRYLEYFDIREDSTGNLFYQVHHFPELSLDIAVVNTSWMSWGGFNKLKDLRTLLVPEAVMREANSNLVEDHTAFLVTHHPTNWLSEWAEDDFLAVCADKYKVHLFGHMHDPQPKATLSLRGTCLLNQSGAIYSDRKRYIGYSITRFDAVTGHAAVHLRSYSDQRRQFHAAEQLIQGGVFYPSPSAAAFWRSNGPVISRSDIASWVKTDLLPKAERELNEGLTERRLCDVFVPPHLVMQTQFKEKDGENDLPQQQQLDLPFEGLLSSGENYIIFGNSEYGKTTLLKQAALRMMEGATAQSATVPVIIDFAQIGQGRDKVLRLIKASIAEEAEGWTIRQLLAEGLMTIMVDDVILTDRDRMDVIRTFASDYLRNRFIFTVTDKEALPSQAVADPNLAVKMQPVFIRQMTRGGMRSLVVKWDTASRLNREEILKRLMTEMKSINVPITAVNGTILLTIYESQANFRPINRAVLIENFIEALLDKSAPSSIERRTFDFTNQKHLLSHISKWMAEGDTYVVDINAMRSIVQVYLDNRGLPNDANKIVDDFIQARIFSPRANGQISFRYRAFSEYFTANQMQVDKSFYSWIVDESRYLSFTNEIIYYAGIHRADSSLLSLVGERFSTIRAEAFKEMGWSPDLMSLESFKFPEDKHDAQHMLADLV